MSGYPKVSPEVIAALAKENRSPEVITIVAAATALGLVCVVLRFYSRVKYVGFVGMEDYFIALSMVSFLPCSSFNRAYISLQDLLRIHFGMLDPRCKIRQRKASIECTYGKHTTASTVPLFRHPRLPRFLDIDQDLNLAPILANLYLQRVQDADIYRHGHLHSLWHHVHCHCNSHLYTSGRVLEFGQETFRQMSQSGRHVPCQRWAEHSSTY